MGTSLVAATSYTVELLSPVHVGTEERLGRYDVLVVRDTLYRIHVDRLLAELESTPQLRDRYLTGGLDEIKQWLQDADRLRRLAIYHYPVPRAPSSREDLRPFLADPLGRPYLPGTELKGAIRTAVLWQLVGAAEDRSGLARQVGRRQNRRGQIEDECDRKHAGQWLEQTLLGSDPKEDTFRLLRVIDTEPVPPTALSVYPVLVAARKDGGFELMQQPRSGGRPSRYTDQPSAAVANFCECLTGVRLRTRVELDRYLQAKWEHKAGFLQNWPDACNAFSRHVAEAEGNLWAQAAGRASPTLRPLADALERFYGQLLRRLGNLPPGHVVLNLGWGGGWRTKTVAEAFGEGLVSGLVRRYRLDRGSGSRPFPKTRKVAWLGAGRFAPLGWVLLIPS